MCQRESLTSSINASLFSIFSILSDIVTSGERVSEVIQAFRDFLGENDMMAYLVMMTPRLIELYRVLKSTGSCTQGIHQKRGYKENKK